MPRASTRPRVGAGAADVGVVAAVTRALLDLLLAAWITLAVVATGVVVVSLVLAQAHVL